MAPGSVDRRRRDREARREERGHVQPYHRRRPLRPHRLRRRRRPCLSQAAPGVVPPPPRRTDPEGGAHHRRVAPRDQRRRIPRNDGEGAQGTRRDERAGSGCAEKLPRPAPFRLGRRQVRCRLERPRGAARGRQGPGARVLPRRRPRPLRHDLGPARRGAARHAQDPRHHREADRSRPRTRRARSTTRSARSSTKARSTGSTTISGRRRSRT